MKGIKYYVYEFLFEETFELKVKRFDRLDEEWLEFIKLNILLTDIMMNRKNSESFLALAQDNLRANGLYLFDEPEAALSPQRQLTKMFINNRQILLDRLLTEC